MTVEELAAIVIDACEAEGIEHMLVGALAYNHYGIPRSTQDVDFVIDLHGSTPLQNLLRRLELSVVFEPQVQFDTLTWGNRQVGTTREPPPIKVELFELFDDNFVKSNFARKVRLRSARIGRDAWVPLPEDIVVQKLRWGRPKDLEDAKDVLAVQGPETLDMPYIEKWCAEHGTTGRLQDALDGIPPL